MFKETYVDIESVIEDIETVIKKEGKDELRYSLGDDKTLVVEVIAVGDKDLEIAVERLDECGNTVESATEDYNCSRDLLWAMIENAVLY